MCSFSLPVVKDIIFIVSFNSKKASRTTKSKPGLVQGFAFKKEDFKIFMAEYINVHKVWLSDLDSISLIGDEGHSCEMYYESIVLRNRNFVNNPILF